MLLTGKTSSWGAEVVSGAAGSKCPHEIIMWWSRWSKKRGNGSSSSSRCDYRFVVMQLHHSQWWYLHGATLEMPERSSRCHIWHWYGFILVSLITDLVQKGWTQIPCKKFVSETLETGSWHVMVCQWFWTHSVRILVGENLNFKGFKKK